MRLERSLPVSAFESQSVTVYAVVLLLVAIGIADSDTAVLLKDSTGGGVGGRLGAGASGGLRARGRQCRQIK